MLQLLSKDEKDVLDLLLDEGPQLAGTLDASLVQCLYNRGLTYLDVPVKDDDFIFGNLSLTVSIDQMREQHGCCLQK